MKAAAVKLARKPNTRRRPKISTTIAPETYKYLRKLIRSGEVEGIGAAVDYLMGEIECYRSRERLEQETEAYYRNMTPEQAADEKALGEWVSRLSQGVNYDAD